MSYAVASDRDRAYAFCCEFYDLVLTEHHRGMVQLKDGEVIAGICYDNFNGHNIMMHVAAKPKIRWITRQLLHEAFKYPFITLGCQRITGWVEASNMEAQKLNHHLGFVAEARMERAAADGGDVILYRMFREHCRYA